MDYSITRDGMILDESKYRIDLDNKVFSSEENGLVIDFGSGVGWTFKTVNHCSFQTGDYCTFDTGNFCTFKTSYDCIFYTGNCCTFSVYDISSQMFKRGSSGIIIDRAGGNHYLLDEEFIRMRNVLKG